MKILVTGGTHGIGKGVAKALAGADNGAHEIIILCRSKELGDSVVKELESTTSNRKIYIIQCDLTKLSDVRNAIEDIKSSHKFLDCIFINAGLGYAAKRVETMDGMDPHFQVNYLSQFMLVLNLLDLLEKSGSAGRVVFNVTETGEIFWDDMQMEKKWGYERGIHQAMAAKRMFLSRLDSLYRNRKDSRLSFIGFQVHKTVWTNQVNIIPTYMKAMATFVKWLGRFITIEECGRVMAPLFTESQEESLKKSGKFITWKNNEFTVIKEDAHILDPELQDRLWEISVKLCSDEKTSQISEALCTNN